MPDKQRKRDAGYLGPEAGPFYCGRCRFFLPQGSVGVEFADHCEKVTGVIDYDACCNLFKPESE